MNDCTLCDRTIFPGVTGAMQVMEHMARHLPVGVQLNFCSRDCFVTYIEWLVEGKVPNHG